MNPTLTLSDFDYELPEERIAQYPVEPRDHSKLLIVNRSTQQLSHALFYNCIDWFQPGDVLVRNTSKVIKARLHGHKPTGGKVEIFLLRQLDDTTWEAMLKHKRTQPGLHIKLADEFTAVAQEPLSATTWKVQFNKPGITRIGEVPLPPYITDSPARDHYQTVYAQQEGSVAAPTAGLHFTQELLSQLERKGVIICDVTLHVGLGTFAPVKTEQIADHTMHAEYAELPEATAQAITQAKAHGNKVIAVGTTSVRTLESFADHCLQGKAASGLVDIFITPGYQFNIIDGLITNFHLPKSTLLMLVSALTGKELMDTAYQTAIAQDYRFYSFGDAMFIV